MGTGAAIDGPATTPSVAAALAIIARTEIRSRAKRLIFTAPDARPAYAPPQTYSPTLPPTELPTPPTGTSAPAIDEYLYPAMELTQCLPDICAPVI
ncbi:hypothetical protein GCM10027167_12830 [Nocardia heshunensis]